MNLEQTFEKIHDILYSVEVIKPCPFCGQEAQERIRNYDSDYSEDNQYVIYCEDCDIEMTSEYVKYRRRKGNNSKYEVEMIQEKIKIIKRWNRRV